MAERELPAFLLASGDLGLLALTEELMRQRHYCVRAVSVASEAIALLPRRRFEIIITDMAMVSAFQEASALDKLDTPCSALKWLVLIGYSDCERVDTALGGRHSLKLFKPFTVEEFFQSLQKLRMMRLRWKR